MKLRHIPLFVLGAAIMALAALGPGVSATSAVIDDFDDNSLASVWKDSSTGTGASVSETNQRIEFEFEADSREGPAPPGAPFGDVSAKVQHECKVTGDFDVRVDFDVTGWPEENGVRVALIVNGTSVQRDWDATFGNVYVGGVGGQAHRVNTTDTTGSMRLTREDSTIAASFNNGGGWQEIASAEENDEPARLTLRAWTHDHLLDQRSEEEAMKDITVSLDNLTIEEGSLSCGEVHGIEFTQAIQELQTIDELQDDLEDDGKPPVPMIAGKPAAMRIYFDEVDQTTNRTVEVSGEVEGTETVTMTTGCDAEERRKQEVGCKSVDFYFTPPEGEWEVTVNVYDDDALVEHYDFELESVETNPLKIVGVDVCDKDLGFFGPWDCWRAWKLWDIREYIVNTFPGDVEFSYHTGMITNDTDNAGMAWWTSVVLELQAMRIFDGLPEGFYHGAVRPTVGNTTSGIGGVGIKNGGAGASRTAYSVKFMDGSQFNEVGPRVMAHELGHNFGFEHVSSGSENCFGSPTDTGPYPGDAPFIEEVGFNVAESKALPPDDYADVMSYCGPSWVSVYTYNTILDQFTAAPAGPAQSASTGSGPSWFVSGFIDEGAVDLQPVFTMEAAPIPSDGGDYSIEVKNAGGSVIASHAFTPLEAEWAELAAPGLFTLLIPVEADAASISIVGPGSEELASRGLGGDVPVVTVQAVVAPEAEAGGGLDISWEVEDADDSEHSFILEYSTDGGVSWTTLEAALKGPGITVDIDRLPGSAQSKVRVLASDGANTGVGESGVFEVPVKLPQGEITSPSDDSVFRSGRLAWLQARAFDQDDGFLDDDSVDWSSSRDGALGTGSSLPVYDLTEGTHTITMTAEDSDGNEVTDSIQVTVFDAPIVEGQIAVKGDVDCDGDVDSVDGLKALSHVAGLPVAQEVGCVPVGSENGSVFGDIDCDGNVTSVDGLFVLRSVAALPVSLPEGCGPIGV
jgi:hypothetical protein